MELKTLAINHLGVAVSLIDANGVLLYYNGKAEDCLDRKPEYIGKDIFSCHQKTASNDKIDEMLAAFKQGRTDPFRYRAQPYGKTVFVTVSPIFESGQFVGCAQVVVPETDLSSTS